MLWSWTFGSMHTVLMDRYICTGSFQKNILIYHSKKTDTLFESPDLGPSELVIEVGMAASKTLPRPLE